MKAAQRQPSRVCLDDAVSAVLMPGFQLAGAFLICAVYQSPPPSPPSGPPPVTTTPKREAGSGAGRGATA
jgi:hypothetical protein